MASRPQDQFWFLCIEVKGLPDQDEAGKIVYAKTENVCNPVGRLDAGLGDLLYADGRPVHFANMLDLWTETLTLFEFG